MIFSTIFFQQINKYTFFRSKKGYYRPWFKKMRYVYVTISNDIILSCLSTWKFQTKLN